MHFKLLIFYAAIWISLFAVLCQSRKEKLNCKKKVGGVTADMNMSL